MRHNQIEKILWSIALPGFGQLLNGKIAKGIVLILLEFLININAHLNEVIIYSFHGATEAAVHHTNYQWLLFYPCVYMFGIWDAHRDAGGKEHRYLFLPYVLAAFVGTIGLIYSSRFRIFGTLPGPVFLPILCLLLGSGLGLIVRRLIIH